MSVSSAFASFRESINNLIRNDKPECATDVIFIFGMLVLLALQLYATFALTTIPYFEVMLAAISTCKMFKAFVKKEN